MKKFQKMLSKVPSYPHLIMKAYKAHNLPAPPLASLNVKWANSNIAKEPKVHYLLLSELLQRKIIDPNFFLSVNEAYFMSYQGFIKNKGTNSVAYCLDCGHVEPVFMKHIRLHYSLSNKWLAFWRLGMRSKRPLPSLSETALGPSLIESLDLEIKNIAKVAQEDDKTRKYALKFSCLHVSYLMACMQLALVFDLLNYQDHDSCVDLIFTHRTLALEMIDSLATRAQ